MKRTKDPKKRHSVPANGAELVFVVDVSSFTKEGFLGTTTYSGKAVGLEFDDEGKGVYLTSEMAGRLGVRKGSRVLLTIEEGSAQASELPIAGVSKSPRISDPGVYYAVGREGGAVVRVRRA